MRRRPEAEERLGELEQKRTLEQLVALCKRARRSRHPADGRAAAAGAGAGRGRAAGHAALHF